MTKKSNRDKSIDVVSGLLIIHMILGHIIQRTGMTSLGIYDAMRYLCFFMPWFFYKSGMYFRPNNIKGCVTGGVKKLIFPYLVYGVVGHLVWCLYIFLEGDRNWIHYILTPLKEIIVSGSISGNMPLWFLLSLFIVRVMANIFFKDDKNVLWVIGACFIISNVLFYIGVKRPFAFTNICTGLLFYSLGYLMRRLQYNIYVVLLALCTYMLFCIFGLTIVDMRSNILIKGIYLLYPLCALSGIILMNNFFRKLKFNVKILEYIGQNSMNYYVVHWILITIIFVIFVLLCKPTVGRQSFVVVSAAICCLLPFSDLMLKKITQKYNSKSWSLFKAV